LRLHQRKDGLGKKVRNFCTQWHTDPKRAQRVPLWHLDEGDVFRLLDDYGKPKGPRYYVVEPYEEPKPVKPNIHATYYYYYHDLIIAKVGDTERLVIRPSSNVIVKPIHGVSMLVLAKLNSFADHNYFPA
jgi:hypothetical protein